MNFIGANPFFYYLLRTNRPARMLGRAMSTSVILEHYLARPQKTAPRQPRQEAHPQEKQFKVYFMDTEFAGTFLHGFTALSSNINTVRNANFNQEVLHPLTTISSISISLPRLLFTLTLLITTRRFKQIRRRKL